jgi:hypothetical protein
MLAEISLAPMWVHVPGLCTLDPALGPPSTPEEFIRRTCLQSQYQTSLPTPQKSYLKFRKLWKISHFVWQNKAKCRGKGQLRFYLGGGIKIFLWIRSHAKLQNPKTTPCGRKVTQTERRREKTLLIVDTEFRAAHASRSDQFIKKSLCMVSEFVAHWWIKMSLTK